MMLKPLTITFFVLLCTAHVSQAQWTQAQSMYGGTITSYADVGDVLLAAVANNGIYRTTNSGDSWEQLLNGAPKGSASKLFVIGSDVYARTSQGFWLSEDKGKTWSLQNDTATFVEMVNIGDVLYGARHDGVFVSGDKGRNWLRALSWGGNKDVRGFVQMRGRLLLAHSQRLYLSDNGGVSWTIDSNGIDKRFLYALTTHEDKVYAGAGSSVYVSHDLGDSWSLLSGLTANQSAYALHMRGDDIFVGTNGKVYHSSDEGKSWQSHAIGSSSVARYIQTHKSHVFVATAAAYSVMGSQTEGVLRSSDKGVSWHRASNGIRGTHVTSTAFDNEHIYAGTSSMGVQRSSDMGTTWVDVGSGLPASSIRCLTASSLGLFVGVGYDVFLSTDYGASWNDLPNRRFSSDSRPYRLQANDTAYYLLSSYALNGYATTDGGEKWREILGRSVAPLGTDGYEMGMALSVDGRICGAIWDGALYITSDGGQTWLPNLALMSDDIFMPYLMGFTVSDDVMYVVDYKNMSRSTDLGHTWSVPKTAFDEGVQLIVAHGKHVFVGMYNGMAYSSNYGETWTRINDGFPTEYPLWVKSISITPTHIVIGTQHHGLWTRPLSEVVSVQHAAPSPPPTTLRVYPNPSQGSTNIAFTTETGAYTTVDVYNVMGEHVATLVNEFKDAGEHSALWNSAVVPQGLYYCRVGQPGAYYLQRSIQILR